MKPKVMYTDRYHQNWYSWHLIYEWEDVLAPALGLQLKDSRKASVITKYASKALNFASRKFHIPDAVLFRLFSFIDLFTFQKKAFYIELDVKRKFYFAASRNTIPLVIDFWKYINLLSFYSTYKNCPAVIVSSIEAYQYLKENNCPLKLYNVPLSLSDKYRLSPDVTFNKTYDIIMPGRINVTLWHFLQEYLKKFPDVEFLHLVDIDRKIYYISNKTGNIGQFQERDEYLELLRSAKVAFYSTPGIDGGESRTGGFDPVTPRFLEMVAAGCHVIARYPKNAETDYFELDKIAPSADSYEIFEAELTKALNANEPPVARNAAYLTKHYTLARVDLLKNIFNQVN